MAIETTFNIRASAKGFTEAGKAVDDLRKKIKEAGNESNLSPGGRIPGRGPAVIPQRPGPYMPGRQPYPMGPGTNPMPVRPPFRPGQGPAVVQPTYPGPVGPTPGRAPLMPNIPSPTAPGVGPATPDPQSTVPGSGDDGGGGPGGGNGRGPRRVGGKKALAAIAQLIAAYKSLAEVTEAANKQIQLVNTHVAAGMGDFRELAGLFRGRGGGGGRSGGGSGGGGGGPAAPRLPKKSDRGSGRYFENNPFAQGAMEGFLPGIGNLINGKRDGKMQFLGRMVGGGARDFVDFGQRAIQAPFRGIGGVQGAISSIPFFGGVLGDATAQAFQNAGTAIGFEGQQQSALPYLGRTGVRGNNLGFRGGPGMFNFDQLSALGMRKAGMGAQQSQQYLTSLAQASGGTADNPLVGGSLSSSLSAFSRFGVGPDVAGLFAQGARNQGASNNNGINGFIRALAAGNQGLGLEGTELQDYMRQMAEDIASFKQTGIPIATESIGALGMSFNASGINGSRAGMLAGSFDKTAQNVGNDGPESVQDYALLQAVAGRPLNGVDDTIDTMNRLAGGLSPKDTQRTFRNLTRFAGQRYGSDKKGRFAQRQFFKGLGLNFTDKEYQGVLNSKDPTLSDDQLGAFNQTLNREALGNVSSVTQSQSQLDNSGLGLGMQGLETYFKSEQFHKDLSQGIVNGLLPTVNRLEKLVTGFYDYTIGRKAATNSFSPGQAITRSR